MPAVGRAAAEAIAASILAANEQVTSALLAQKGPVRSGADPPEHVSAGQDESRHGDSNPEPSDYKASRPSSN
jgi:hypothetical protein